MSHTFNYVPFYFGMIFAEFFGQFIDGLPNDFNMLHKSEKKDWICKHFIMPVFISILNNYINGIQNMGQSDAVVDFISHKLIFCHVELKVWQMAVADPLRQYLPCVRRFLKDCKSYGIWT